MKTPLNVLLIAIGYWLAIYGITQVPNVINNYHLNLVWLTVVIPNVFHMMVGRFPQLAVDRSFFFATSVIALILTYVFNMLFKRTREDLKEYGTDKGKTLKTNALLMGMLTVGALITYYSGIDNSIYSNMGWETNI
jgi:undecaprenyl pyrophosphate phosphatase UppP